MKITSFIRAGSKTLHVPRYTVSHVPHKLILKVLQPYGVLARTSHMWYIAGHIFTLYPKFHCECNFIERYWGAAKRTARQKCEYSFKSLCEKLPSFLDGVALAVIRRFARQAWRYIDAYRQGKAGKLAEFATTQYTSHRRIPETLDSSI